MSVQLLTQFAAEEATGVATLGIDIKALLLQAGTFLILYLLFRKYALGKVVKTLADRREKIDEGLANADLMEKKLAELKDETDKQLKEARVESDAIIAKASEESGRIIAEAEEAAAHRAENMIDDAKKAMTADIAKAKRELRGDMLELVASATAVVVDEKVDAKKDSQLIERAIAGVENE